jgi:hypothetical protein
LRHTAVALNSNFAARSNILDRRLDEVGVGAATGHLNDSRTTAWTVDLGTRRRLKPLQTTILLRSFKKIVKNTVNGVDIMS